MTIKSIAQLRKLIKPMGYNVRLKTFSFGKSATFYKGGEKCPHIFFENTLKDWQPLFNLLSTLDLDIDEKVYGLRDYTNIYQKEEG